MKAIYTTLIALLCTVTLTSCDKKDDTNKILDPNAKVYINGTTAPQPAPALAELRSRASETSTEQVRLTPRQVVEQANRMWYGANDMVMTGRGDVINERFRGDAIWVIDQDGILETELIEARNFLFTIQDPVTDFATDTVAYIPNATMATAETAIKTAYAAKNYEECYRLFEEALIFTPITGAEYKVLKAANEL